MINYTLTTLKILNPTSTTYKLNLPDPVLDKALYTVGKEFVNQCKFVLISPIGISLVSDTHCPFVTKESTLAAWATCKLNKNFWKETHRYETSKDRNARLSNIYTSIEDEGLVFGIETMVFYKDALETLIHQNSEEYKGYKVLFNKKTMTTNDIEKEEYDLSKYSLFIREKIIVKQRP